MPTLTALREPLPAEPPSLRARGREWRETRTGASTQPRWARLGLLAVLAVAAFLCLFELTRNGEAAMREHGELHPWQSLRQNLRLAANLRRVEGLAGVVAFYVLTVFVEQMSLFQILFFGETLRFGANILSLVPVSVALVTMLMYGLVLRRLTGVPAERALVFARLLGLAGAALVLLIPAGNSAMLLLATSVLAAATFLTQTYRDAALFSRLPQQGAADLYSAVQTLTLLFSIPAAAIAGAIYAAQPRALFALIAALNVGLLLLALSLASRQRRTVER